MFPDIQFDYKLMDGGKKYVHTKMRMVLYIYVCTGFYLKVNYVGITANIDSASNRTNTIA